MEPQIKAAYHEGVLPAVLQRYHLTPDDLTKELEGFESHVFEVVYQDTPCILKITHSSRRSPEYIQAEIDFVNHLAAKGCSVAQVLTSPGGAFLECLPAEADGHYFMGMVYQKLPGEEIETEDVTSQILEKLGAAMGQMHAAVQDFEAGATRRRAWNEEPLFEIHKWIPATEAAVLKAGEELLHTLGQRPQTPEIYDLTHSDLHHGNFLWDGTDVHIFDFDDSDYQWFVNDIAVTCFYFLVHLEEAERQQFLEDFMLHFVKGYSQHFALPQTEWRWMPQFWRLRELLLIALTYQTWDVDSFSEKRKANMEKRKTRFVSGDFGVQFDFEGFEPIP